MYKILILANDFPPKNTVGSERPYSWSKYFPKYGVNVTVVTKEYTYLRDEFNDVLKNKNIIRAESNLDFSSKIIANFGENKYVFIRKLFTLFYRLTHFFLPIGIHYSIYKAAKLELKKNSYDCILATGEPFILFSYASKLSKRYRIPWFADYRDDWIQNHSRIYSNNKIDLFFLRYERYWEKRILKNVKGFTSVSEYLVNQISKRINIKTYEVVENGVDLENYKNLETPFQKHSFNIVYTGMLYDQPYMEDFIKGFELFVEQIKDIEPVKIYFIGIEQSLNQATRTIYDFAIKYPEVFIFLPRMSPVKVASFQYYANLLLSFIPGDPEKGIIAAKTYVYASTRNPILTIPTVKNNKSPFLPNRNVQFIATTEQEICQYILHVYQLFNKNLSVKNDLTDDEVFKLSREYSSMKMLKFILQ